MASLSGEQLAEAFLDLAAGSTFRRADRHPALQNRDFLIVIALFAVDDRGLLGVPGGWFASVAIALCRFNGAVTQFQGIVEAPFALCLLDRLDQRQVQRCAGGWCGRRWWCC